MDELHNVRKDYSMHVLLEGHVYDNPFDQFTKWLEEVRQSGDPDYNAMTLATVDDRGFPNQRVVLLREFSKQGAVFYTNYLSVKGKEIDKDPKVGLNFFWKEFERQVRMHGEARKLPSDVSDAYFASRPRENQISAWASEQSTVVSGREELERRLTEIEERFQGKEVPRPPHWGGYLVFPIRFEFWQGRPGRLHDRLVYNCDSDGLWFLERLAP